MIRECTDQNKADRECSFEQAWICNLLEERERQAAVCGNEIEVVLKAYEVVRYCQVKEKINDRNKI